MLLQRRPVFASFAALSAVLALVPARAETGTYNVLDYGAVPDGKTMNTAAFAKTVDACAQANGGIILVPAGHYLTGSVQLKSNMTLRLDPGSELLYSGNPSDSPVVASRWEDTSAYIHAPLVYAADAVNVAVVGRGTLNGQGWNWWWRSGKRERGKFGAVQAAHDAWLKLYDRIEAGEKPAASEFALADDYLRPPLVLLNGCKNVLIEGVTLRESPMWMLHPLYCEDVVIRGVRFDSTGPNGDGVDIDSSRDVRISDCFFNTGDDCIVIKSGRDADGRRINRPTEHVSITNCVMYKGHGAIAIGSETSGGIRDVVADNIVSRGTDYGIRIKSQRGRGNIIENLRFSNFVIDEPRVNAIEITALYMHQPEEPLSVRTPIFRNLAFSNFTIVNAAQVANIRGLPEKAFEQIRFTDLTATGKKGMICDHTDDLELHQVRIGATVGSAFNFDQVHTLELDDVTSMAPLGAEPVISLKNSTEVWLHASRAAVGTVVFVRDQDAAGELKLGDNNLSAARTPVAR
ncbi:MAG TPA: glycoside hydrolase family 28 protein [Opitutaceae bacterium]|jgi:polygalacturonase